MENQSKSKKNPASRINSNSNIINELGRIPPQAIDIEQAVLGAMLLEKNAVSDAIDILNVESFYDPKHQYIFNAIQTLFGQSSPIDLITVVEFLKKSGELEAAGGTVYISTLTNRIASTANIEFHARIISERHIKRELIKMCSTIIKDSFDDTKDVFEILGNAEGELFQIAENNFGKSVDNMHNVVRQAIEEIEVAAQNKSGISGVPTGFVELDKLTSGWQRSDMVVIAARPGMGKTAFVLSMARNTAVEFDMGVAIFSLEMSSVQLVKRLIASESRLKAEKLRKGDLAEHEFQQLHSRIAKLTTAPIFIDDTPGLSIFDLRAKCRRLKMQHNIELVIIDYLQLMSVGDAKGSGNRVQDISTISRSIKEIAKEINVPIIALSQLSRSVETRGGDKRPILSDLRESGAIEQDADIVSFIYRPEYYGITEDENGLPNDGIGEIIIAKHRNGSLDTVKLQFIGEFALFKNLDNYNSLESSNDIESNNNITILSKMNSVDSGSDFDSSFKDDLPF